MAIDFKKNLASVQLISTIENFDVRYTDTGGHRVNALVEHRTDEDEDIWEVVDVMADCCPDISGYIREADKVDIIRLVKEQLKR